MRVEQVIDKKTANLMFSMENTFHQLRCLSEVSKTITARDG